MKNIYLLITVLAIDVLFFEISFGYQRASLELGRELNLTSKALQEFQIQVASTFIGFLGWFQYVTLVLSCVLLWQYYWWLIPIYIVFRVFILGLLPSLAFIFRAKVAEKAKTVRILSNPKI